MELLLSNEGSRVLAGHGAHGGHYEQHAQRQPYDLPSSASPMPSIFDTLSLPSDASSLEEAAGALHPHSMLGGGPGTTQGGARFSGHESLQQALTRASLPTTSLSPLRTGGLSSNSRPAFAYAADGDIGEDGSRSDSRGLCALGLSSADLPPELIDQLLRERAIHGGSAADAGLGAMPHALSAHHTQSYRPSSSQQSLQLGMRRALDGSAPARAGGAHVSMASLAGDPAAPFAPQPLRPQPARGSSQTGALSGALSGGPGGGAWQLSAPAQQMSFEGVPVVAMNAAQLIAEGQKHRMRLSAQRRLVGPGGQPQAPGDIPFGSSLQMAPPADQAGARGSGGLGTTHTQAIAHRLRQLSLQVYATELSRLAPDLQAVLLELLRMEEATGGLRPL